MKHLKLFENFQDIDSICEEYDITNYTINPDGTIDVDGNVTLQDKGLSKLPLKFGKVAGFFNCSGNNLISLQGSPREVGGSFYCHRNQLTSLEGSPREVGGHFECGNNKLRSLEGGPMEVGGDFSCGHNQLTSLEGGPKEVGGDFNCYRNDLISLEGSPTEVGGDFYCDYNPIYNVYNLFDNYKQYQDSLDYNYIRGTDIIKSRFEEALQEIGEEVPKEIKGYNYI